MCFAKEFMPTIEQVKFRVVTSPSTFRALAIWTRERTEGRSEDADQHLLLSLVEVLEEAKSLPVEAELDDTCIMCGGSTVLPGDDHESCTFCVKGRVRGGVARAQSDGGNATKKALGAALKILCLCFLFSNASCGLARSDSGVHAETIPGNDTSVQCYAVVDGNGDVKGGNCVRK